MLTSSSATNSTSCCGITPFDKTWGTGYEPGCTDFSPIPRTNKLRKDSFEQPNRLDSQRILLYTEAFKKYESYPLVIKEARALENCLLNFELHYYDDELFLGDLGGGNHNAQVYQEFSNKWMFDELKHSPLYEREVFAVDYDDKIRDEILSCEEYWSGKAIADEIESRLTWDEKKASNMGKLLFFLNLYHYSGIGHCCPDFKMIINAGLGGLKQQVLDAMAQDDRTSGEGIQRYEFHQAQLIVLDALCSYIGRYARYAQEVAETKTDERLKGELLRMSANCEHLAGGGVPRDMWETLQLMHFAHQLVLIESQGHSISFGRIDQYLNPVYLNDMKNGTFTKEFIQELMEAFWLKSQTMLKIRDKQTGTANNGGNRGWGGTSLTFGGMDRQGNDATNDLTFMWLDCVAHCRTASPWPALRWHKGTPHELKVKAAELIKLGTGHSKLYNDEPAIEACMKKGVPLEDARDYAVVGCVEINIPGQEYGWHDSAYFSLPKVLELALNDGRCTNCSERCPLYAKCGGAGSQLGIRTGSLKDFTSFEQLKEAYVKQLDYWLNILVSCCEVMDLCHQERKALPWLSTCMNDCTKRGLDISKGGARYNGQGPQGNGLGTVTDSLCAIKQLVFDEKRFTGEDFLRAMKENWGPGNEVLYAVVNSEKTHHYGNDDDYADEIAKFVFDSYCENLAGRKSNRNGQYNPGVYSVSSNVPFGLVLGATPDGRKAMEAISDNLGPVHTAVSTHDCKGPTALANSIGKIDHTKATNGTLVNVKFTTEAVSGETGRDNLIDYLDAYMAQDPLHIQVMVADGRVLRDAQAHPENYRDMLVRVSGYSAFFVDLGVNLQNDLINRTELSFE